MKREEWRFLYERENIQGAEENFSFHFSKIRYWNFLRRSFHSIGIHFLHGYHSGPRQKWLSDGTNILVWWRYISNVRKMCLKPTFISVPGMIKAGHFSSPAGFLSSLSVTNDLGSCGNQTGTTARSAADKRDPRPASPRRPTSGARTKGASHSSVEVPPTGQVHKSSD